MPNPIVAGTVITRLRAKIPDSVFVAGIPRPDMDGKFRVQTLYAWLDDGVKTLTQLTGWTVDDWWAMPQVALQPWYDVQDAFVSMTNAFSNQWALDTTGINEEDTIWPQSNGPMNTQPLAAFVSRLASNLQVGVWPAPNTTDPATTLTVALSVSGPDPITVGDTTDFLSYGYLMIEDELVQYQQVVSATQVGTISRGVGGTTPVAHAAGVAVQHLGLWIKGKRLPMPIENSLSPVEVPRGWMSHLQTYVLGMCRLEQKGRAPEGDRLIAQFEAACKGINADPNWKVNQGRIRAFGEAAVGPLYPYGMGIIVP